jgi:SAM-dependent methyltransferase
MFSQNHKLVCPDCHSDITEKENAFSCAICRKEYPVIDNIPDFRRNDEYWCNVSRDKMQLLNHKAREMNDWQSAAKSVIPEYLEHFESFDRADAQFIWPIDAQARVLDAGSMWGGLTIPVAQFVRQVFAVDKTVETLSFLNIRARQMGFDNIYPMAATLDRLPFLDNYFDLVILNGVLEWAAFRQDVILERQWNNRVSGNKKYPKNPFSMQVAVLKELRRVTKPCGYLFLAIENRIGCQYLMGYPDDHVNIRFVPFLPRFIADLITRLKKGHSYRTYIYSSMGCKNILKKAGYAGLKMYGAFPHYISPNRIVCFDLIANFKKLIISCGGKRVKIFFSIVPRSIMKFFSPSLIAIAKKDSGEISDPRIISLLKKAGVLKAGEAGIEPILLKNRSGDGLPLNCLIYDRHAGKPLFFCKISRSKGCAEALDDESKNLLTVNKLLTDIGLRNKIPSVLYYGSIDGISFLVTNYLDCQAFKVRNVSRRNCNVFNQAVKLSLDFLIDFQRSTFTRELSVRDYLAGLKGKDQGIEDDLLKRKMSQYFTRKAEFAGLKLKMCAIHGDFDFYSNIMRGEYNQIRVVDFEHFEQEGLPTFDLATLIFHPFLMDYKSRTRDIGFGGYLKKVGGVDLINRHLVDYCSKSGIETGAMDYFLKLALFAHNAKVYPSYRDKASYLVCDRPVLSDLFDIDFGK